MSPASARPVTVLAVLALLLATPRVFAKGPAPPTQPLRYVAPSECPSSDEYFRRVEARLGRDWERALRDFAERIDVTLANNQGRYDGTIEFTTKQGEHFTRSVSGRVCSEVVDGLSLMTALAVRSRDTSSQPASLGENVAPNTSTSVDDSPRAEPPSARSTPSPREPRQTSAPRGAHPLRLRVGARLSLSTGIGPGAALGVGATSALELGKAVIAISADITSATNVRANDARADFRLTTARLEGCPWTIALTRSTTFEPCLLGELGAFRAAARVAPPEVTISEPATVSWGAVGALGRLVFRFRPGFAEVAVFARAPVRRERFYVGAEEQVVFRIPAVSGGGLAGLGLEF